MIIEHLTYPPELLDSWHKKALQFKWRQEYDDIFDDDDLRIALSQQKYHFGEWFVARHYAQQGYKVLVEKYLYPKSHLKKYMALEKICGFDWIESLKQLLNHPKPRHQAPDLFVYKGKKFFFAEVKRDADSLGDTQRQSFERIEKHFHCEVRICALKAKS
jgi:hypothetical protein